MNEMKTLFRTLVGLLEILALLMVIPAASLFIHCVRQADPSNTSNLIAAVYAANVLGIVYVLLVDAAVGAINRRLFPDGAR